MNFREWFEEMARRYPAGGIVTLRTLDDVLAPLHDAWTTAGHRGAVLDALRDCCSPKWQAPLPAWLAQIVEEVVMQWSREAPTGERGRHARFVVTRRETVRDLMRGEFYQQQRERGLEDEDAKAITAEWFRCSERTIGYSLARVADLAPGARYLAMDDRHQYVAWLRDPAEIARLKELVKRYPPPRRTPARRASR